MQHSLMKDEAQGVFEVLSSLLREKELRGEIARRENDRSPPERRKPFPDCFLH